MRNFSRTRFSFDPSPERDAERQFRREKRYSGLVQREDQKLTRDAQTSALTRGVPDSALPPGGVHPGMSQADQVAAVSRAGRARGEPMNFGSNPIGSRDPDIERAANSAISRSPVPFTANTQNANVVAATSTAKPAQPMGRTLSPSAGDALLGERSVTPGTNQYGTASVRTAAPGEALKPKTVTDTGVTREGPFDTGQARIALQKAHPNIFQAGTPENQAFVAHAQKYGEEAAHKNVDSLMQTLRGQQGGPTSQMAKNDMGEQPTPERVADLDKSTTEAAPSVATQAGRAISRVAQIDKGIVNVPGKIARGIDKVATDVASGITGRPTPVTPMQSSGRAVADWFAPKPPVADNTEEQRRRIPLGF